MHIIVARTWTNLPLPMTTVKNTVEEAWTQ